MAEVFNYNIFFDNQQGSGGGNRSGSFVKPENEGVPVISDPTQTTSTLKNAAQLAPVMAIGKNLMNFATSNVQTFTGSSFKQEQVNNILSLAGTAVAFKINPMLGAAMLAVNMATRAITSMEYMRRDNLRVSHTILRAGPHFNQSRIGL